MDGVSRFQDLFSCVRDTNHQATSSTPGVSLYRYSLPRKSPFSMASMSSTTATFPYNSLILNQDLKLQICFFNIVPDDSIGHRLCGLELAHQQATYGGYTEHSSLKFLCQKEE